MKKILLVMLSAAIMFNMTACSMFETEYVSIEEIKPPAQADSTQLNTERVVVRSYSGLKQAIENLVYSSQSDGTIIFDPEYEGDAAEDLASACWKLRTGNALCAYCVDNISYSLTQIVTYFEAQLHVTYGSVDYDIDNIIKKNYFTGIDTLVKQTFESGEEKLVFLINSSNYGEDDLKELAAKQYTANPYIAPYEPEIAVRVYSGEGRQRLYELTVDYGVSKDELAVSRAELMELDPFEDSSLEEMSDIEKVLFVYNYLSENCSLNPEAGNTAYNALMYCEADSKGIALAFVELCRRIGIESQMVVGQYLWNDYCWNIFKADGVYYHADAGHGLLEERPFMMTDSQMWDFYRWDTTQYPACSE